jgi:DNA polymerase-4
MDMDAFYVSVELQRRPELRGLPVVVAGSGPRAVVTTASYEARKYGVFSATPASRARRLCPQAVFVQPEFDHYRERSRAVMEVVAQQIEVVEVVGLDEAYLDLSPLESPKAAARRTKAAVLEVTGLVCSIGIGPNKLVAKVSSDAGKPDGFLALTAAEARERFSGHSPGLIPGIGPKSVERLRQRGIDTLGALAEAPDDTLAEWFGSRLGPHLGCLARFEDERPIETERVRKSESRETTFDTDLRGLVELEPVLERLTAQLSADMERHGRRGRTVGIKVRLDDFSTHTRARTLTRAVNDTPTMLGVARDLLVALDPQRPVRLLGVRVAGLDAEAPADADGRGAESQLELTL